MQKPGLSSTTTVPGPLDCYQVPDGSADELFDIDGQMRPVWKPFIDQFLRLSPAEIAARFSRGDQYLRDAGVYYRHYSSDPLNERDWPLSHVPVILAEAEWRGIADGLRQRAEVLERVVADLYGPQELIAGGHLPPELVAQSPQWLRPLVGVKPRSGHFLHFLAFEIGRSPDGSWFVLGDRTQAPSGAGFALENRMATSRVFSDPFSRANVHRLAGFFRVFRDALDALRGDAGGRPAILSPGPNTDTYFEHAYIARYLGLMLLEGEDLTVEAGRVMVRTVAGLKPVGVLWRRLDAVFADPLELDDRSRIGTPGLVNAVREGRLSMVNALGTGILETRAMLAFIPRIAAKVFGEPLRMPNIATWWCGHAAERAYVRTHADRMMIGHALSCDLPFDVNAATALGGQFRDQARASIDDWIEAEAGNLVGQEAVSLSTTPAYQDGRMQPRPMTVRVFAARTSDGWRIMPGGYARIGRSDDVTALAMQRGGSVADVWVVSDTPVVAESLVPPDGPYRRRSLSILPSRAADNLCWLGRYVERAEGTIRLLRAYNLRLAETGDADDPRVARIATHLAEVDVDPAVPVPKALVAQVNAAVTCAGKVRDRFSVDGWSALRDLQKTVTGMTATAVPGDDCARAMGVLLRKLAGFSGLVHENMYRFTGWRFLSFGRALERADFIAAVLADFAEPDAPDGSFDIAVELGDSVMTHQRRYRVETNRNTVIDLLALDDSNPRAILFQLGAMTSHVADMPTAESDLQMSDLPRALLRLQTELRIARPEEMTVQRLDTVRAELADIMHLLSAEYLR